MPAVRKQAVPESRDWYFTEEELRLNTPSRRDGISFVKESELRSHYCSHIQKTGRNLKLPHHTIATAMMMCHRFYTRQSHAKNCWHTVASSCILLASKLRDTPRFLDDVAFVVYECEIRNVITDMMTRKKLNPLDKRERDEFSKGKVEVLKREKKELLIKAERLVLQTIGLDHIEDPYKALVVALKMFMMSDKITDLTKMAWSLVEEWLKTSLSLQYEPKYIAVGSVVVAARVLGMKLPAGENFWMKELDVSPKLLDEVVRLMQSRIGERKTKKTIRIVSFYEITCR